MHRNRGGTKGRDLRIGKRPCALGRFGQVKGGIADLGLESVGLKPQDDVVNTVAFFPFVSSPVLLSCGLHRCEDGIDFLLRAILFDIGHHGLPIKVQPVFPRILRKGHYVIDKIQIYRNIHVMIGYALDRFLIIERDRLQIFAVKIRHPEVKLPECHMGKPEPQNIVLYGFA